MLFAANNPLAGPPAVVWLGRTPQTRTQCPRLSAARPPCVVTGPLHSPFRGAHTGRVSTLETTNRADWMSPTLRFGYGPSSSPRALHSAQWHGLRPVTRTLSGGACVRQGVALDPARSLQAPLQTMVKGAVALPFKTHDRGDFALPWPPSPNPARVEMRGTSREIHQRQGAALGCGRAAA